MKWCYKFQWVCLLCRHYAFFNSTMVLSITKFLFYAHSSNKNNAFYTNIICSLYNNNALYGNVICTCYVFVQCHAVCMGNLYFYEEYLFFILWSTMLVLWIRILYAMLALWNLNSFSCANVMNSNQHYKLLLVVPILLIACFLCFHYGVLYPLNFILYSLLKQQQSILH
jgi:hypothetical protein